MTDLAHELPGQKQKTEELANPGLSLVPQPSDATPEFWEPVLDAFAQASGETYDSGQRAPFARLVQRQLRGSTDGLTSMALIEALAAHPEPELKVLAAHNIGRILTSKSLYDGDRVFRVAKGLAEDVEAISEAIEIAHEKFEDLAVDALKKMYAGITTYWWERRQGFIEQVAEISGGRSI